MARPRTYPAGATAAAYKARERAALRASGGKIVTLSLSAEGVAALAIVRAHTGTATDTAAIEQLILEAARQGEEAGR